MSLPIETNQIILKKAPVKSAVLDWDATDATFERRKSVVEEIPDGHALVKVLYLSNDPTQRNWMNQLSSKRNYVPSIEEGSPVRSIALAEVIESKVKGYSKGDIIHCVTNWVQYDVVPQQMIFNKTFESPGVTTVDFLSSLGMTGLTAYFGIKEVGQLKKGQSVIVNGASGATGSMVIQVAKHILGAARVVAITLSEEKCDWVQKIGADFAVSYHDKDYKQKIREYLKDDLVDVLFDNVGGEMLSSLFSLIKQYGTIVACGAIAGYNDELKKAVNNWSTIIQYEFTVKGFLVLTFGDRYKEGIQELATAIAKGTITTTEGVSVIDLSKDENPLEKVPETWLRLFAANKPFGKLVTKIA